MPSLLHLIPGPHVSIPGTADTASCRPKSCPVETWEFHEVTSKESSPFGVVSSPLPSSKIWMGVMPSGQAQRRCSLWPCTDGSFGSEGAWADQKKKNPGCNFPKSWLARVQSCLAELCHGWEGSKWGGLTSSVQEWA